MKSVELYARVRRAVFIDGLSKREAARLFGIDRRTVDKMLRFSVPPGYRRSKPVRRPKLDPFTEIIDGILKDDSARPKKQRHTSKRIFERLRDEHGFAGGITIVKDYVHAARERQREMFVPLSHRPGHAQADFGEALAVIGGVERKIRFLAMDLPHSDGCFVKAYLSWRWKSARTEKNPARAHTHSIINAVVDDLHPPPVVCPVIFRPLDDDKTIALENKIVVAHNIVVRAIDDPIG